MLSCRNPLAFTASTGLEYALLLRFVATIVCYLEFVL
jgi:hypothetical protein